MSDLFKFEDRKSSCDQADINNSSQIESETPSKGEVTDMLSGYYFYCLRPVYKKGYADLEGRGNSEAQSYAMLQSVWMDDSKTFRHVWIWTKQNLQRPEDNLFSWDFDLKHDFWSYPFKKAVIKDYNSATDADEDIAMALILAGEKWEKEEYIVEARKIIKGIWENEVSEHNGKLYLLPGKWGANEKEVVINTSYFSPAAYRIFARYDNEHDWNKLISDSYLILDEIRRGVNRGEKNELPPNWVVLNKATGQYGQFTGKVDSYDYSYDAFRTLWRAGFDQLTSPSFESWDYVSSFNFIEDWEDDHNLCTMYNYKNNRLECDTTPTGLAANIGTFSVTNGFVADEIIKRYYIHDGKLKFPEESFYAKSWHWFGTYLWSRS